jgi:hypothetical protein
MSNATRAPPIAGVERRPQLFLTDGVRANVGAIVAERVSRSELNLDPTVVGLRPGDRQCRLSHVNAQNRQSQRGDVKSVLAGPAARIEHRPGESAFGCQTHDCWLRLAGIPRRRAVVVGRVPGQSRQPFVTGRVPTTERIVSEGS